MPHTGVEREPHHSPKMYQTLLYAPSQFKTNPHIHACACTKFLIWLQELCERAAFLQRALEEDQTTRDEVARSYQVCVRAALHADSARWRASNGGKLLHVA